MHFFKKFYFSYIFLGITIILFSQSFSDYENGFRITLLFLFLANFTCFSTEYLIIRYFENKNKNNLKTGKVYATFVMSQVVITLIIFFTFKSVF
ncbi:hypothetical protein COI66_23870 [Bacillus toyonensis]|nr:hypothetical protein CON08_25655 [Bacillus cereus]PHG04273.1 hypothetical protein COI66_23870 [Bacillus toyonensis]